MYLFILFSVIIKDGLCASYNLADLFRPYLLPQFVSAAAAVFYRHSFFYSHDTLPLTFFRPLGVDLTVEIYQGLIS